jgi:hypothetical protein
MKFGVGVFLIRSCRVREFHENLPSDSQDLLTDVNEFIPVLYMFIV